MSDTVDNILDQTIEALGTEPDGHQTWALTTDEICKELRPILEKELALAIQLERERIIKEVIGEDENTNLDPGAAPFWMVSGRNNLRIEQRDKINSLSPSEDSV